MCLWHLLVTLTFYQSRISYHQEGRYLSVYNHAPHLPELREKPRWQARRLTHFPREYRTPGRALSPPIWQNQKHCTEWNSPAEKWVIGELSVLDGLAQQLGVIVAGKSASFDSWLFDSLQIFINQYCSAEVQPPGIAVYGVAWDYLCLQFWSFCCFSGSSPREE